MLLAQARPTMISLAPISKILDIDRTGKSMICCYLFYCCVKNNATINNHTQTFVWGFEFCTYITCNVLNKGQTHIMGTSGGEELLGERHQHEVSVLRSACDYTPL